jgi:hypothetical protein
MRLKRVRIEKQIHQPRAAGRTVVPARRDLWIEWPRCRGWAYSRPRRPTRQIFCFLVVRAHAWRGVPADHRSRRLPFPLTRLASTSPGYRTSPNRLSSTFPSLPIFLLVTNHISLLEGEALSLGPNFFLCTTPGIRVVGLESRLLQRHYANTRSSSPGTGSNGFSFISQ